MKNMTVFFSQFAINFQKSHRLSQCTLQLVSEDRVLFVWVYLHFSSCGQQHPKCNQFISCTHISSVNFALHPSHKQKFNGDNVGDSNTSLSATIQNQIQFRMNSDRYYHLLHYRPFLQNHSVYRICEIKCWLFCEWRHVLGCIWGRWSVLCHCRLVSE